MHPLFFCLLSLVALAQSALSADSVCVFQDTACRTYAWEIECRNNPNVPKSVLSSAAALHGDAGIELTKGVPGFYVLSATLPFFSDFWTRFYFQYDFADYPIRLNKNFITLLMQFSFFERTQKQQPAGSVYFELAPPDNGEKYFLLNMGTRTSEQNVGMPAAHIRVSSNALHCVETHVTFTPNDSFSIEFYVDNESVGKTVLTYSFPKERIQLLTSNDNLGSAGGKLSVRLDDVSIGSRRLFPIPSTPVNCSTQITDYKPFLSFVLPLHPKERIVSTRFQLFSTTRKPSLYDVILKGPNDISKLEIPFELDSGHFFWKAALENEFGNWGDFSKPCYFEMRNQRPVAWPMQSPFFTAVGKKRPLTQVERGEWYDLHFPFNGDYRLIKGIQRAYALVWFHHETYSEGNVSNKGGKFLPQDNFVYNFSFSAQEREPPVWFEKSVPNSLRSKLVTLQSPGLYISNLPGSAVLDTVQKEIRMRIKILEEARPGQWYLEGFSAVSFIDQGKENFSKLVLTPVSIVTDLEQRVIFSWKWGVFVVLGLLLALLAVVFKLKKPVFHPDELTPKIGHADLERIQAYISSHLGEKISLNEVLQSLHLSRNRFYGVMASQKQTLPDMVNRLRVEKAKKMLINNREKNIEEISLLLGYKASKHFSAIFKNFEGVSPTEYRNQRQ